MHEFYFKLKFKTLNSFKIQNLTFNIILMIPVFPEARALIFDIDGTLVDSMPIHYKASQLICHSFGFDFPLDFFLAHAGTPTEEVFKLLISKLGLDLDGDVIGNLKDKKYLEIMHEAKPLKEVYEVALKYRNILPIALGTGANRAVAMQTLKAAGLEKEFDIIVTADDVKKGKPSPETFLLCAEKMGIEPRFCQVFEDADPGIQAAKIGGMMVTDIRKYVKMTI
jgi:HAD superfamily hydrolase (TIGR01509 family)